jgi:hypothetical protein
MVNSSEVDRSIITYLETALNTDMNLNIDKRAIVLAPLERVTRVAVLLVISIRGSTI